MSRTLHFRAMSIQTLVGNAGGYIGLFLGYSCLQIPTVILATYRMLQKRYSKSATKVKSFA